MSSRCFVNWAPVPELKRSQRLLNGVLATQLHCDWFRRVACDNSLRGTFPAFEVLDLLEGPKISTRRPRGSRPSIRLIRLIMPLSAYLYGERVVCSEQFAHHGSGSIAGRSSRYVGALGTRRPVKAPSGVSYRRRRIRCAFSIWGSGFIRHDPVSGRRN